jgi:hypothetical protein
MDVTVTVDDCPAASPVTVNGSVDPEAVPATTEPAEANGVHVHESSQFVTFTVNPPLVLTGASNVGVRAGDGGAT